MNQPPVPAGQTSPRAAQLAPPARRSILAAAGVGGLSLAGLGALSACSVQSAAGGSGTSSTGGRELKIGYVTPQTGALAAFGEADSYVIEALTPILAKGLKIGDATHPVKVIVKDSQSDPKRAADVANELIQQQQVDLILVASTPDTTNPVSDQCEANGVPCVATVAPWQAWYFGRGATPDKPFTWTYHFFWGLDDIVGVYTDMWKELGISSGPVGALAPNDSDGKAWSDPKTGGFPMIQGMGYDIVDGGRYENLTNDFSAQIAKYKQAAVPALFGVPLPPDFTTFWKQAAQQGFTPKIATIAKAILFPSSVEALGPIGHNLSTEVWWSPAHPFTSSLTSQSAQELATSFTATTKKQWTQPLGLVHALFEVGIAALIASGDVEDKSKVAASIGKLKLDTVAGTIDFTAGPVPNVATTSLVGGQWRQKSDGAFDLVIVSNKKHPEIPTAGSVEAL
ncbi:MAG: ABC transporter substrate-binding protein [Nostocoides sp.]